MINPKNKRIEITLSSEELELLKSICLRFNISKSRAFSQALKVFAAKRKHIITLSYKESDEKISHNETNKDIPETKDEKSWDEMMGELYKDRES